MSNDYIRELERIRAKTGEISLAAFLLFCTVVSMTALMVIGEHLGEVESTPTRADVIYTACQESGRYIYPDQRIIKCEVW